MSTSAPSPGLAKADAARPLPSVTNTLHAPPGMAFAVKHNPEDDTYTLHIMPKDQAAIPSPQSTADGPQSSVVPNNEKEKNPIMMKLRKYSNRQSFIWLSAMFVFTVSFNLLVAANPGDQIISMALHTSVLPLTYILTPLGDSPKPRSSTSAKPSDTLYAFVRINIVLRIFALISQWIIASDIGGVMTFLAAIVDTVSMLMSFTNLSILTSLYDDVYSAKDMQDAFERTSQKPKRISMLSIRAMAISLIIFTVLSTPLHGMAIVCQMLLRTVSTAWQSAINHVESSAAAGL